MSGTKTKLSMLAVTAAKMRPYKYSPETDTVSNGECTMLVLDEMPAWENKDLFEGKDFEVDLHPDNHNIGIVIPT